MAAVDINAKFSAADDDNDSRKWMIYTSDAGTKYSVFISENAGEVLGFDDVDGTTIPPNLPKGFQLRKINAVSSNGKVRNSFPVGKPDTPIYVEGGTVVVARKGVTAGLTLAVTGTTGEKKRLVTAADSGQQSGDNS